MGNAAQIHVYTSCHQIPAELIQLDPDCVSKVKATSTSCKNEGEVEERKGRRKGCGSGKAGGKREALKRQRRREEQGKVWEIF